MRHLVLVIGILITSPAIADVDRPRYTRAQKLDLEVRTAKRATRPRASVTPRRPIVTADDVLAAEHHSQPLRSEQEAILEKLVADTPDDDPDKPDLLLRLAEHYAGQLRFWRVKAIDTTQKIAR